MNRRGAGNSSSSTPEWGRSRELAPVRKSIYSLPVLNELLRAANRRCLAFLSSLDDWSAGLRHLDHVTRPVQEGTRTYRGFSPLHGEDRLLFEVLARGEFNISGFQNRDLRRHLNDLSGSQVCRILKRLRTHGLVKKVGGTYK